MSYFPGNPARGSKPRGELGQALTSFVFIKVDVRFTPTAFRTTHSGYVSRTSGTASPLPHRQEAFHRNGTPRPESRMYGNG